MIHMNLPFFYKINILELSICTISKDSGFSIIVNDKIILLIV